MDAHNQPYDFEVVSNVRKIFCFTNIYFYIYNQLKDLYIMSLWRIYRIPMFNYSFSDNILKLWRFNYRFTTLYLLLNYFRITLYCNFVHHIKAFIASGW